MAFLLLVLWNCPELFFWCFDWMYKIVCSPHGALGPSTVSCCMPASAAWWFHWHREGRPYTGQKIGRVAQASPSVVATAKAKVWKTVGAASHIYVLSKGKSTTTFPPLPLFSSFELLFSEAGEKKPPFLKQIGIYPSSVPPWPICSLGRRGWWAFLGK